MTDQFEKNEHVAYGNNGICWIEDIRPMSFAARQEACLYYILRPVRNQSETIFVPSHSDALVSRMRPVLSKMEIDTLLKKAGQEELAWVEDKNARANLFHKLLNNGSRQELVQLAQCIYQKRIERTAEGKKLPVSDETVLRSAEKLVEEEFAFALCIPQTQVAAYIRAKLTQA